MYGTIASPDRRVDKSFPSSSPSLDESNKPYFNDKLGNDLDKSYDDLNHNSKSITNGINSSSTNGSSSSTRKPYPSPGRFSGRYPIKQSPSSLSNDKSVKKPNVQSIDNNDINLLSPINQNTQHNSGMNCKQLRVETSIIIIIIIFINYPLILNLLFTKYNWSTLNLPQRKLI